MSTEIPPYNLKPESTTSYETGLEMKFLNNRIESEFTVYQSRTSNQIMGVAVSSATGFKTKRINAGVIENKGFEWILTLKPIEKQRFAWEIAWNYARNRNKVVELYGSMKALKIGDFWGENMEAQPNKPLGVIMVTPFLRNSEGKRVVGEDGCFIADRNVKDCGNIMPDWLGGLRNQIRIGQVTVGFLLDFKMGGDLFSLSHNLGTYSGVYEETLPGREDGLIADGVKEDGTANDIRVDAETYYKALSNISEADVFDASYIKLRDAYITYSIPMRLLRKLRLSKATVSLTGYNLLLIYSNIPNVDPETAFSTENELQGYEFSQIPSTRSLGVQIRIEL